MSHLTSRPAARDTLKNQSQSRPALKRERSSVCTPPGQNCKWAPVDSRRLPLCRERSSAPTMIETRARSNATMTISRSGPSANGRMTGAGRECSSISSARQHCRRGIRPRAAKAGEHSPRLQDLRPWITRDCGPGTELQQARKTPPTAQTAFRSPREASAEKRFATTMAHQRSLAPRRRTNDHGYSLRHCCNSAAQKCSKEFIEVVAAPSLFRSASSRNGAITAR
jgi:hypothetical protein